MKNQIKWSEILTQNEDAIIDALKQAYRQACGSQANSGWQECVDITQEGRISVYTIGQNSTSGDVWSGETLEIARVDWFNPTDGIEADDVIKFLRNESKLDDWVAYLVAEELITQEEADDISNTYYYTYTIQDWNQELWKQYLSEVEDWLINEFAENRAEGIFSDTLKHAQEVESMYGEA